MEIGIFAKTFRRSSLAATLDAVARHGIGCVQFNLVCAGLSTLPECIDGADQIRHELAVRQIRMAAVSGTFNMIHPDLAQRRHGLSRLRVLIAACRALGTSVITLCTGTRDAENMWRRHPDNQSPAAWRELVASMKEATGIAAEHGVTLAFEPELANVVDSAQQGRRLLEEIGSPHLKVVMDAANLCRAREPARMRETLAEAFALFGPDIILAHAKDLSPDRAADHVAAGTGLLDYDHYLALLRQAGYDGPIILHNLAENQVDAAVAFLRAKGARS